MLDHIRNHRLETTPMTSWGSFTQSVMERYCEHCKAWVEVKGVTGALRFMAEHGHKE